MLCDYLRGAISDLRSLVHYTGMDIDDIQRANNDEIFERNKVKLSLIKEFEAKKGLIDQEVVLLSKRSPSSSISELLDAEAASLIDEMKQSLEELKSINIKYARIVFAVSEFYSSLLNRMVPRDKSDYKGSVPRSQVLRVRA